MTTEIDGLKEVCETAQIVQTEEKEIAAIESKIANRMREITKKIFSGETKYRMRKQKMIYDGLPTSEYSGETLTVWANISICLKDDIKFRNDFVGDWTGLRVTTSGQIVAITQTVSGVRSYDLTDGDWHISPYARVPRKATDHEIAIHAKELAKEVLDALRHRIDTMKDEKETLQRLAQAIS